MRFRLPFITRPRHDREVAKLQSAIAYRNSQIDSLGRIRRDEREQTQRVLANIVPKFSRVELRMHPESGTVAIYVSFNVGLLEMALCHGDSERAIELISWDISRRVEQELCQLNRFRPIDAGLRK